VLLARILSSCWRSQAQRNSNAANRVSHLILTSCLAQPFSVVKGFEWTDPENPTPYNEGLVPLDELG